MAKRKRTTTYDSINRWINQGRGQGSGEDYKPWLRIQDVPSNGRASRIHGIKANRVHHLMSDLETGYFYMLDYSDNVLDIREQFPLLPLEQTQDIAEELGIKHPADPHSKEDIVMTTDFLILIHSGNKPVNIARTIKPENELDKIRVLEKLEIEREYWKRQNVDWGIVTNREINNIFIQNIKVFHQYYDICNCTEFDNISIEIVNKCKSMLLESLMEKKAIKDICHQCDDRLGLTVGASLVLFRHMVITKTVALDLHSSIIDFTRPAEFKLKFIEKDVVAG